MINAYTKKKEKLQQLDNSKELDKKEQTKHKASKGTQNPVTINNNILIKQQPFNLYLRALWLRNSSRALSDSLLFPGQ